MLALDLIKHYHQAMQFENRIIRVTEDGRHNVPIFRISLEVEGGLSYIDWELNGELYFIKVPLINRRQGIATKLWQAANKYIADNNLPKLKHSPYRTDDGDAWARSISNDLPERIAT